MTATTPPTAPQPLTHPVPLIDLGLQHRWIADDVLAGMTEVMERTSFVLGPQVAEFEQAYAAFTGTGHCVGVGNGTDALELALRAGGLAPGDEVIVPANTFVATAEAVLRAGARLRLADCGPDFLLDPASLIERITPRTRAVVGVDLYGQVAGFERIRGAVGDDVLLFEDAAQAQGAMRQGRPAGSFGVAAGTSFYPGKNLGAYGDAGAVTTNDPDVAARLRALRNHGGVRRHEHDLIGTNSRLDSLQAVVLSLKLARLTHWNQERRIAAQRYDVLLADVDGITLPETTEGNEHVWHLYVVRVADRDRVLAELNAGGIGAGVHYPTPIHLLPAYAELGLGRGSFPVAERLAGEILSLPIYPGITESQQGSVAAALTASVRRSRQ